MTMGILENILAAIQQNTAAINALAAARAGGGTAVNSAIGTQDAGLAISPPAPVQPSLGATGVTSEQLMALIQPHIANEAIKAALGTAMRNLGVNTLPEAQPHHFGPLFQAFQAVIVQHTAGGGLAAPASNSII